MRFSAAIIRRTLFLAFPLLFLLSLFLVSCGAKHDGDAGSRAASDAGRSGPVRMMKLPPSAPDVSTESEVRAPEASEAPSGYADESSGFGPAPRLSMSEPRMSSSRKRTSTSTPESPGSGQLTAGEWNDLREWDFWRSLEGRSDLSGEQEQSFDGWGFRSDARVAVTVVSNGRPRVDVPVKLFDGDEEIWEARTDVRGEAELFARMTESGSNNESGQYRVQVGEGQMSRTALVTPGSVRRTRIEIPSSQSASATSNTIDVMFVIDATGSMGDEMEYLKSELGDVVARVSRRVGTQREIRLSSNYYRDHDDEYLVRSFPFTTRIESVLQQMAGQSADGGGDIPEAVESGLADALEKHDWSRSATTRLLFLVLDAPPHQTPAVAREIQRLTELAALKGVRIIPVASSGIEKPTEFFLRNLAIMTGGTYVFLTNHSGIGNDHIEPTIGEYKVEFLDDLIERLIVQYSTMVVPMSEEGAGLR